MESKENYSTRKTGNEKFQSSEVETDFYLLNFWQWSASNLLSNTTRGKLAEYIVAKALDIADNIRVEWESHDLTTKSGVKIEVKSSAFVQGWHQKKNIYC